MGTYLVNSRREQLQDELERHLVTSQNGRCAGCGEPEPCRRRNELSETFFAYGVLPRRRPRPRSHTPPSIDTPTDERRTPPDTWSWWRPRT